MLICCAKTCRCRKGRLTLLLPPDHLYSLVPLPTFFTRCLTRNGKKGLKTLPDFRQRSDFSLGMAQGFGHKSRRIHIYQTGAGFCPMEKEDPEWALQQTSPSWSALLGAAKRLLQQLFDCCPPVTSRAWQRTQTRSLTHTHTHSTLPSTFSRMAAYNTPGPHQTESPAAPFEK